MSNNIQEFFGAIDKCLESSKPLSSEYLTAMDQVGSAVETWCLSNNLGVTKNVFGRDTLVAVETYAVNELPSAVGAQSIKELCEKCGVATEHLEAAMKRVAGLLYATLGKREGQALMEYRSTARESKTFASLETLYPAGVINDFGNAASLESFGINIDRVQPDLKTILTIALMQFHTNLTPRIVPIQTVNQGNVTIVRESMEVFDMAENARMPVRLIELYKDPKMVSVCAIRIKPLKANDAEGEFLVADDIYKFRKSINLFAMAQNENKIGYEKYNHTDLVEEGIVVDGILIKITTTKQLGEGTAGDFYAMLHVPAGRGRLTQVSDDLRSSDRRLNLDRFAVALDKDYGAFTGVSSLASTEGVLAGLVDGLSLRVDLHMNFHVDRKVAMADANGWLGARLVKADGSELTEAEQQWIDGVTVELVGWTMDARYNEDNKRKSSIRAEINRRSMSYELPTGRNFVVDTAIGQDGAQNAAARLAQLEHIGRDANNLDIIGEVMRAVHDQNVSFNNDKESQMQLAATYAAGDLVNPYVYMNTLDMSGLYGIRSGDMSGDIKQYVKQYFNRITSGILAKSLYQQQLASGAKVAFRLITSPEILGNLFMMKHFHQHLDTDEKGTGGVEHSVVLDNGVRLDIVTTNFRSMETKIIMIPFLGDAQGSMLNFGTDFDQGTMVGSFPIGTDGGSSFNRMFSVTRELLIPTNVIGAVIDVVGTSAVNMTGEGSITVNGTEG